MVNDKESLKAERERTVFTEFAHAIALPVDISTIESRRPPDADIRCRVNGQIIECEMGEITDAPVAGSLSESLKTGEASGAAFSHDEPLLTLFQDKARRTYRTRGIKLLLVAYYDKQYPPEYDLAMIPETVGKIAERMVSSGAWDGVYVYDTWNHQLLWQWPPEPEAG